MKSGYVQHGGVMLEVPTDCLNRDQAGWADSCSHNLLFYVELPGALLVRGWWVGGVER